MKIIPPIIDKFVSIKNNFIILYKIAKWLAKAILVITGILPLSRCSSGYQDNGGKITFNGKEITDKSFVVLNNTFAKDDSAAYYKDYRISGADAKTFSALDKHYAKDRYSVFYCDEEREGQNYYLTKHSVIFKVKDADPASFTIMGQGYEGYAKDSKRAYEKGTGFEVKDVSSLTIIDGRFVKDKHHVYFERAAVKNAEVNSFRTISNCYAKDSARVYYFGFHNELYHGIHEIPCEVASFTMLEYPYSKDNKSAFYVYNRINGSDAGSFSIVGKGFSKDKNHVYLETKMLKAADAATFVLLPHENGMSDEYYYARDKDHIFLRDKMFEKIDANAFKVLGLGYSTDGKKIYFRTAILKDADPASFKVYDHGYGDADAEDASNKYLEGTKVVVE